MLTLALGIGLAAAVFTVAEAFLLRPLPVRDQNRIVVLWGATRDGSLDNFPLHVAEVRDVALRARSLERVESFGRHGSAPVPIRIDGKITRLRVALVSGGFFDLLGVRPLLGRGLRPEDDVKGAARVVVLSYGAWQRYFGGDPHIVGRSLVGHETGEAFPIVGVMPQGLDYPRDTEFWTAVLPNTQPLLGDSVYAELDIIARLRANASLANARQDLQAYFTRDGAPRWHRNLVAVSHSFTEAVLGETQPAVIALAAAAGLLLLITCINVATLLLVRGLAREREMAVRSALGASRPVLVRQLLLESALLAAAGAMLGLGIAMSAVKIFIAIAPADLPRLDEVHLDGAFVGAAIGLTVLVMLLFALAPALVTSRVDVQETLRAGSRQSGGSRRFRIGTEALVAGQMALAVVVLAAAGLLARSLLELERLDLRFEPSQLLVAELALPFEQRVGETEKELALLDRLLPRLAATPGIVAATPVLIRPFAGDVYVAQMGAKGQTPDESHRNPMLSIQVVSPNHFQTLGIGIRRGRAFTSSDVPGAPHVAILSESAARHYWPGRDPVGQRLTMDSADVIVVGIVADTRYSNMREPRGSIYFPMRQNLFPVAPTTLVVRTLGDPATMVPTLRRVVNDVAPTVGVVSAAPFDDLLDGPRAQPRFNAILLSVFALAALALAAVGLYGVIATMVRQRTREIGVRIALGATSKDMLRLVVGRGLVIAALGATAGLVGAVIAGRLLAAMLFQVAPTDVVTLGGAAGALLLVAMLASLLPARASARTDPMIALRTDG